MHSTDQNAEYTPTTNVHTVGKLVATFTDSKRTTKQHRARTCHHNRLNCLFVITIRLPPISTGQQSKPLDRFQLIDWTQETNYTAPLEIRGDEIQRKQYLHLAKLQRKVNTFQKWIDEINALQFCCKDFTSTTTTTTTNLFQYFWLWANSLID